MARSSQKEPVEKFRFQVTFLDPQSFSLANLIGNGPFETEGDGAIRAGFTQITPPKANVNIIEYRENNDMNRASKQPGLVSYDPVVLRGGVTTNRGLYNWYKEIHNDVYDLNKANEVAAAVNWVPVHGIKFRREMVISSLDREGKGVKHWLLLNCFPMSYQGADDFNASSEEKLIEEMVVTYEAMVELKGSNLKEALEDADQQALEAALDAAGAVLIGATVGGIAGGIAGAFK